MATIDDIISWASGLPVRQPQSWRDRTSQSLPSSRPFGLRRLLASAGRGCPAVRRTAPAHTLPLPASLPPYASSLRSPWRAAGDAVRRLLVAGEQSLSAQDEDEIITFAKAALSLAPPPTHITPAPPAPGIFSGTPATAIAVQLLSIDDVQHVNIIESGKTLPFAETGVTVIYGSNGSGNRATPAS